MIVKNGKRLDGFCADSLPIGTLQPFLGLKAPNGYLICDGSLISKAVYPDLYVICGSLFGEETETHFYLPDLRGKTVAGYDPNDDTFNILGLSLGEKTHLLTELESGIREHTHAMPLAQTAGVQNMTDVAYRATTAGAIDPEFRTGRVTGIHKTNPNDYAAPYLSGQRDANAINAHNNIQPTMVANWIVKAKMIVPVTAYVENTLDSVSESNALSAAQGRVLNDKINSLSTVASTGSYNDLINKPERVDYTSQITCDYGTLNSNFNYCFLKDDVVYLNLTYTLNTALTAGTQYDFCKIPAAIRPKGNVIMYAFSHTVSHMITNYVRSTGELVIAPEKAVPAGKEINMWTVYYIK